MDTFIRIAAAIFIPPLGVFLTVGIGTDFWINLVLTFFGFIPGNTLVSFLWSSAL
jgi:uncharacterized membrane protein YqaE (UPF0057 family)